MGLSSRHGLSPIAPSGFHENPNHQMDDLGAHFRKPVWYLRNYGKTLEILWSFIMFILGYTPLVDMPYGCFNNQKLAMLCQTMLKQWRRVLLKKCQFCQQCGIDRHGYETNYDHWAWWHGETKDLSLFTLEETMLGKNFDSQLQTLRFEMICSTLTTLGRPQISHCFLLRNQWCWCLKTDLLSQLRAVNSTSSFWWSYAGTPWSLSKISVLKITQTAVAAGS